MPWRGASKDIKQTTLPGAPTGFNICNAQVTNPNAASGILRA